MGTVATTPFEFLKDLPQNEEDLPQSIREELSEYTAALKSENGLLPTAACPALLGVTRQRFYQLRDEYGFKQFKFFDKVFFSRQQLEDFYKVQRKSGAPGSDLAKAIKATLSGE